MEVMPITSYPGSMVVWMVNPLMRNVQSQAVIVNVQTSKLQSTYGSSFRFLHLVP